MGAEGAAFAPMGWVMTKRVGFSRGWNGNNGTDGWDGGADVKGYD
jgi:hypothetical protein